MTRITRSGLARQRSIARRGAGTISHADAIERRPLDLAYTTTAKLTATALAYYAPCSIDDATLVLDDLAARDASR